MSWHIDSIGSALTAVGLLSGEQRAAGIRRLSSAGHRLPSRSETLMLSLIFLQRQELQLQEAQWQAQLADHLNESIQFCLNKLRPQTITYLSFFSNSQNSFRASQSFCIVLYCIQVFI